MSKIKTQLVWWLVSQWVTQSESQLMTPLVSQSGSQWVNLEVSQWVSVEVSQSVMKKYIFLMEMWFKRVLKTIQLHYPL